jgi:AcrR family transcriptional regulator
MPRDTFFNLEESKRNKIIRAAVTEFTNNELHKARVSNIIKEANIPRGSFYQYFVDIDDLFYYVIDTQFDSIFNEGLKQSEQTTDLFEFVRLTFKLDVGSYLNDTKRKFRRNVFRSISNNYEYLEYHNAKRRKYILDVLDKIDLSNIKPMTEDELIGFYEFLQGVKNMIIQKTIINNDTEKQAMDKLNWVLDMIQNGIKR